MKRKREYIWDEELNVATCIITEKNNTFTGRAYCHPSDLDMANQKTGFYIAEARADINFLKHIKKNEILPALNALKHLYYTMKHSSHFDDKSYEAKMLYRQIKQKEEDLETIKADIADAEAQLRRYCDSKEEFYQAIRKNRGKNS